MQSPATTASTPAGHTYNIEWPGDSHGGGSKPAIPPKKRAEFLADVRGEHLDDEQKPVPALTVAELRKKWSKHLPSDRTLFKWTKWANELKAEPKKRGQYKKRGAAEPTTTTELAQVDA